jgi:hypothetical protein
MSNEYKEMKKWEVAKLLEEGNKMEAKGMAEGAYCYFDAKRLDHFRYREGYKSYPMKGVWRCNKWRIRKYIPEIVETCSGWRPYKQDAVKQMVEAIRQGGDVLSIMVNLSEGYDKFEILTNDEINEILEESYRLYFKGK